MDELIEEMGHVAEVGRTLLAFSASNSTALSLSEIVTLANNTAGLTGRYPSPRAALRFSEQVGLVKRLRNRYELTQLGLQYLRNARAIEMTVEQGRLLLGILLDDAEMRERMRAVFSHTRGDKAIFLPQESLASTTLVMTVRFLQQIGCFIYRDATFILNPAFEDIVEDLIRTRTALSENALWKRLEAQRLRGMHIEECVVRNEQARLQALQRPELADAVSRVSAMDVSAGYDIISFETDGSPRHIEVKSSVGTKLEFEWSENERVVAEKLGATYWIYFVPLSHLVQDKISTMVRIRNPIQKLKRRQLLYRPSAWHVFASETLKKKIAPSIDGCLTCDL